MWSMMCWLHDIDLCGDVESTMRGQASIQISLSIDWQYDIMRIFAQCLHLIGHLDSLCPELCYCISHLRLRNGVPTSNFQQQTLSDWDIWRLKKKLLLCYWIFSCITLFYFIFFLYILTSLCNKIINW